MNDKEKYISLCEKEKSICVYDMPWWLDAVCGHDNWDVIVYEKGNNILGAMPYFVKQKLGMKYITQPQFTQHNGIWLNYPSNMNESKRISFEKEVISAIMEQVENLGLTYYMQNYSPSLTNWLPFYWRGYTQTGYYTYRIEDISNAEELFKKFQSNKRKNINKALRNGYVVQYDLSAQDFYHLHELSLKKQGKKISYSFELFERIYNAAYKNGAGCTIYARNNEEKPISALFNIWDSKWGYNLISAIDPDTRNFGVADLLVYSMIGFLSDKVKGYDFEGSMIPGVEESFRHFGAHQTMYFTIRKIYSKNPVVRFLIQNKIQS